MPFRVTRLWGVFEQRYMLLTKAVLSTDTKEELQAIWGDGHIIKESSEWSSDAWDEFNGKLHIAQVRAQRGTGT